MDKQTKGNARGGKEWLQKVVDELCSQVERGEHPSLSLLLQELINAIMVRERERFLSQTSGEQANGFYPRNLHLTLGKLRLKVPRVRFSHSFRPAILPPRWKRVDKDYEELLIAMLANGYSRAQMERALKRLGLPFSEEALAEAQALIREHLNFYQTQPLKADLFAVLIDAYHAKMRTEERKIQEISLFVALGIDLEGNKGILGFWVCRGRENKAFWVEVLQDLINRGLHRVLIFVTDDFKGIDEVIQKLFPYADHQLCQIHLRRNLKRHLSREGYRKARWFLQRVRQAQDREEGEHCFEELCQVVAEEKPRWAKELRGKAASYLAFLEYPEEVRSHIYSTNPVESLNSGIEAMRIHLGGYFPSQNSLEVNLFVQIVNWQDSWSRRPVPTIRAVSYKLHQLFALRYELDREEEIVVHKF
jgi:transposase-like protein